jgi:hypothetical protein
MRASLQTSTASENDVSEKGTPPFSSTRLPTVASPFQRVASLFGLCGENLQRNGRKARHRCNGQSGAISEPLYYTGCHAQPVKLPARARTQGHRGRRGECRLRAAVRRSWAGSGRRGCARSSRSASSSTIRPQQQGGRAGFRRGVDREHAQLPRDRCVTACPCQHHRQFQCRQPQSSCRASPAGTYAPRRTRACASSAAGC